MHIITSIGNTISAKEVDIFVNNFLDYGVIDEKIAKLLKGATNEKDELRTKIFKSMLINLV